MGAYRREPVNGHQPEQWQDSADAHETGEADTVEQRETKRATGGESPVHPHPN
jgi:hypothetical protein